MGFKEDIEDDIESSFLDIDIFADKHIVDGREIVASIDGDVLKKRGENDEKSHENGTHRKRMVLYANIKELGKLPAVNNIISVDGRKYVVTESCESAGMAEVTLEVRRS